MKINIQSVKFNADQKLVNHIESKLSKLERFFDHITGVDVFLKLDEQSSTVKDKVVSIRCRVPGTQLFAEETSKTFEVSVDQAMQSLSRQVKKYKAKKRA